MKSLKCSGLHSREVMVPDCVDGQPCRRVYHIFLPRVLCHGGAGRRTESNEYFDGHYYRVGTLPLVFLLHGFGNDSRSMMNFIPIADEHHFVLAFPEGLENSFNGGDCCGYALENKIDDVGFISQIIGTMTAEFNFLQRSFTFGIGHNNGAFLLTHALESNPHMFKSIVPISGYTHHIDQIRSKLGVGRGIGLMMHHSLDDSYVRPSGCCDNTHLPKCHGDVHSNFCMPVLQLFDLWAGQINMCDANVGDPAGFGSAYFSDVIAGRSGGLEYSLSHQNESQSSMFTLKPDIEDPEHIDTLYKSNIPMSISYHVPSNAAACLTTPSSSCSANTTLCLYQNEGDFHGDFGKEFPPLMFNEVMGFIEREACTHGMMEVLPGNPAKGSKPKNVCACYVTSQSEKFHDFGGVFCYDPLNEDGTFKVLPSYHASETLPTDPADIISFQEAAETVEMPNEILPTAPSESFQEAAESHEIPGETIITAAPAPALNTVITSTVPAESAVEEEKPLASPAVNEPEPSHITETKPNSTMTSASSSSGAMVSSRPALTETATSQNAATKMSDLATDESHATQKSHSAIIWSFSLLAIATVFGMTLIFRRRRRIRQKKVTFENKEAQSQDDTIFFDSSLNPYRDYFQKRNAQKNEEEDVIDIWDSEQVEHYCPPWRSKQESESGLVNRHDKHAGHGIGGSLDSSEWDEHQSPYQLSSSTKANDIDEQIDQIVDDFSFSKSSLGNLGNASQKSSQVLPDSLVNVINQASYLDSTDRSLLNQYRQSKKLESDTEILRRQSDPPPDGELDSPLHNITKGKADSLDDDLEKIESEVSSSSSAEVV